MTDTAGRERLREARTEAGRALLRSALVSDVYATDFLIAIRRIENEAAALAGSSAPAMEPRTTRPRDERIPVDVDEIEMRWAAAWSESDDGIRRAWHEDVAALIDLYRETRRIANRYYEEMVRRTPGSSDPEAVGLDVERLASAMDEAYFTPTLAFLDDHQGFWRPFAETVAAEYARLTKAKPESPAAEETK